MPVFANRPAVCILDTGEAAVLLSEPAQRSRGLSRFLDPINKQEIYTVYETPRRREMLGWLLITNGDVIPLEPTVTPIFIREKDSESGGTKEVLDYFRHAQSLDVVYNSELKTFTVLFYWNLFTPVKQGPPQDSQDSIIQTFLSTYKNLPISWSLPLGSFEPHAEQLLVPVPEFPFAVGDPPLDPGGAWPGVYNFFDIKKTLLVGSSALHKNFDPFQLTDAHQSLPVTPGFVTSDVFQKEVELIDLSAIEDFLNDHTQHLYHQREVQASRMATRVLMFASGQVENLILKEEFPGRDDPVINFQGLTIGASNLTPGILQQPYVGVNSVHIESGGSVYPFGAVIPDFAVVIPGDIGHQFKASGGQPPYQWCLRRTRSSETKPAQEPQITVSQSPPGSPPSPLSPPPPSNLYPFDDFGDLLDPEPPFPPATQDGGIPPGMLLDINGLFYGTPGSFGVYVFRLHVKDVNGLRGEATIRFEVLENELKDPQCSQTRGEYPAVYKASISFIDVPSLLTPDLIDGWVGQVGAIGGENEAYFFTLPEKSDPPRQQVPISGGAPLLEIDASDGILVMNGLTPENFDDYAGVWVFEIQVKEYTPPTLTGTATCDVRGMAVSIGTTIIGGVDDTLLTTIPDGTIPEGKYRPYFSQPGPPPPPPPGPPSPPSSIANNIRPYLILDTPQPVLALTQGKNVYLAGSPPFNLNPQIGGLNFDEGIITSVNPGFSNPVSVIGVKEDSLSPAHIYMNWLNSNPTTFFRDIYDRFDPVPVLVSPPPEPPPPPGPPLPPGSPPVPPPPPAPTITGGQIDDFIPVGKRIRPLWPI